MIVRAQQTEPHRRLWTDDEYARLGELGFFDGQEVELIAGDLLVRDPSSLRPRPWTKAQYYRLGELGFLDGQKAELLGGEIVVASPQNWPHAAGWDRVAEVLRNALAGAAWVRTQSPLDLGLTVEPEPDVSVVSGRRTDYSAHPTTALLIVEVSDATLAFDRNEKASLYAAAGIADYWIVNLGGDRLEVRRHPIADSNATHGHRYADLTVLTRADQVTPLAFPALALPVADLLP